jgi:hypothetical protein
MRILTDLSSHILGTPLIVQSERTPQGGQAGRVNISGKFAIPVVTGVEFPVDSSSYVLDGTGDVDGGDVSSISYSHLLAMYPMFNNVYFNPLLTPGQVDEIDFPFVFNDSFSDPPNVHQFSVRVQTGRPVGTTIPGPAGQMPTHTALMPVNSTTTPPRPGLLVTKSVDLTPYTVDASGFNRFVVYWKLYAFDTTHDVSYSDVNEPASRFIMEPDQEPAGFSAMLSGDDGATWCQVGLMEPLGLCDKTNSIRLAFSNLSPNKLYLATYAVLF